MASDNTTHVSPSYGYALVCEGTVYGYGHTERDAERDAYEWLDEAGLDIDDCRFVIITDDQAARIAAGTVSCRALGI